MTLLNLISVLMLTKTVALDIQLIDFDLDNAFVASNTSYLRSRNTYILSRMAKAVQAPNYSPHPTVNFVVSGTARVILHFQPSLFVQILRLLLIDPLVVTLIQILLQAGYILSFNPLLPLGLPKS